MEVTTDNFQQVLPHVVASIKSSLFVAIDTELTGLHSAPWLRPLPLDTVDSRWARIRDSAAKFSVLQFGVCCFAWDEGRRAFEARPFAFYLHPRQSAVGLDRDGGGEAVVSVSAEALTFLSRHHFDFNKGVAKGIPWLSAEAERAIRAERAAEASMRLQRSLAPHDAASVVGGAGGRGAPSQGGDSSASAAAAAAPPPPRLVVLSGGAAGGDAPAPPPPAPQDVVVRSPADLEWFAGLSAAISDWVTRARAWTAAGAASDAAPAHGLAVETDAGGRGFPFIVLDPVNGFRRLVVRMHVEDVVRGLADEGAPAPIVVWSRRDDQVGPGVSDFSKRLRLVWVGAAGPQYAAHQAATALAEVDALVDAAVGFRAVIDAITHAGVPVVGHNCQLDFAHSTAKFVGHARGLPPNVTSWAAALGGLFPGGVWDTKAMVAGGGPLAPLFAGRTSLGEAYAIVQRRGGGGGGGALAWLPPPPLVAPADADAAACDAVDAAAIAAVRGSDAGAGVGRRGNGNGNGNGGGGNGGATPTTAAGGVKRRWEDRFADAGASAAVDVDFPSLVPVILAAATPAAAPAAAAAAAGGAAAPADSQSLTAPVDGDAAALLLPPDDAGAASPDATAAAIVDIAPPLADMSLAFEDFAHDAGADAAMTGIVFLRCVALLAASVEPIAPRRPAAAGAAPVAASPVVASPSDSDAGSPTLAGAGTGLAGLTIAAAPAPAEAALPAAWPTGGASRSGTLRTASPEALVAVLRSLRVGGAAAAAAPTAATAAAGAPAATVGPFLPYLRAFRGLLFQMRVTAPEHRLLSVEDAAAVARAGNPRAAAPAPSGVDARNTLLAARAAADQSRLLHVEGLTLCVDTDALAARVAEAAGIAPRLIDRRRHVTWVDDRSAFVTLPSRMHVFAAADALNAEAAAARARTSGAPADELEDDVPAYADVRAGENMLGMGGFADRVADAAAAVLASGRRAAEAVAAGLAGGDGDDIDAAVNGPAAATDAQRDALRGPLERPLLLARPYAGFLAAHRDVFMDGCAHEVNKPSFAAPRPAPPVEMAAPTTQAAAASTGDAGASPRRPSCCLM